MFWNNVEIAHMRLAIDQARCGLYSTFANPRVGCVLVQGNQVVGKGYHRGDGHPHAEVMALVQAAENAKGATVFVTLEPCNHHGKQPPCTQVLIQAGVARVVYATADPNPQVTGNGASTLRAAGICVQSGLLADEARALNVGFFKRIEHGLPWVRAKLAISIDGRIAAADTTSRYISAASARSQVMQLRAASQAILTTGATVLADNPLLSVRPVDGQASILQKQGSVCMQPQVWIIDSGATILPSANVFAKVPAFNVIPPDSHTQNQCENDRKVVWNTLAHPQHKLPKHVEHRIAAIEQVQQTDTIAQHVVPKLPLKISLRALLQEMVARGINEVLTESGGGLVGALIAAQFVDELVCYHAPILLGDKGIPMARLAITTMHEAIPWRLIEHTQVGENWRSVFVPVHSG